MARRLRADGSQERVPGMDLRIGDLVVVEAGQLIPGDGEVVEGIATVDECGRSTGSPACTPTRKARSLR